METFPQLFWDGLREVYGRASGPLHFRLFVMPTVITFFAIRAALRNGKAGTALFPRQFFKTKDRQRAIQGAARDIGKIVIVAIVLDTTYQLTQLRSFYLVQLVVVVIATTILPYLLARGITTLVLLALGRSAPPAKSDSAEDAATGGRL